jgi:TonB family protein
MKADASSDLLTFGWNRVQRMPLALAGFILVSFSIHLAAFFLFRVVYPPQASLPLLPGSVSLLDPERPDHQALLRWVESEDAEPLDQSGDLTERLLDVPYRPSFATPRTAPLTLPLEPSTPKFPPARDSLAIIRSGESSPVEPDSIPARQPTRAKFGEPLAGRSARSTALAIRGTTTQPLETATFFVGVSPRGQVQHVIAQQSSGDAALDAEAAAALWKWEFEPAEEPIAWGDVAVSWGPEVYSRSDRAEP